MLLPQTFRIVFQEKTNDGRGVKTYKEDSIIPATDLLSTTGADLLKTTGPELLLQRVAEKYQELDRDEKDLAEDLVSAPEYV